ncbi:hypothetical protein [Joostella sp. CR20]|uniref:hypothetical protein n=1 Tax=Joostella sp. CR20 TaxID=2804312 RepID=UPI00313B58CE
MESYKKTIFRIMSDNEERLEQTLKWYNDLYDTDFKIVNIVYDEVNFVDLESTKFTLTDIFNIGYQLGVKIQNLRDLGEID